MNQKDIIDDDIHQRINDRLILIIAYFSSLVFPFSVALKFTTGVSDLVVITCFIISISSIAWITLRRRLNINNKKPLPDVSRKLSLLIQTFFWCILTFSIEIFYFRPEAHIRPSIFLILILALIFLVLLQIISREKFNVINRIFIICNIIVIGLELRISESYLYSSVLGQDPWYHQWIGNYIVSTGSIPSNTAYSALPIFHIEIALGSELFNLSYKDSTTLTIVLLEVFVSAIVIYCIGRMLFNDKVGLIGALLVIISDQWVRFGWWTIPNTLGAILIILIVFSILRYWQARSIRMVAVLLILTFTLVLTHSFSSLYLLAMLVGSLVAFWCHNRFIREKKIGIIRGLRNYVVLFFVVMFSWWTYVSFHVDYLANMLRHGFYSPDQVLQTTYLIYSQKYVLEYIIGLLGELCFLGFAYFGLLWMLSAKRNEVNRLYSWVSVLSLICIPIAILPGATLLSDRWRLFAEGLLCIPLAIIISRIDIPLMKRKAWIHNIKSVVGIIAIMSLSFLLVMNVAANMDNPLLSSHLTVQVGLTDSEMEGAAFSSNYYLKETIITDQFYTNGFIQYYGLEPIIMQDFKDSIVSHNFSNLNGNIVLRNTVANSICDLGGGPWRCDYNIYAAFEEDGAMIVYSNGGITVYYLR